MEGVRQFVEIVCQQVWTKIVQDGWPHFGELTELQREISLFRCSERDLLSRAEFFAGLSKDGADADVGILQIRRGVSLERQHPIPGKNVIGHPILREIGILYSADANDLRYFVALVLRQLRIFFGDDFPRPDYGLVEDVA